MSVTFYRPGQSEGGLFLNDRKQHDRSPDMNGRCLLTIEDCQALLREAQAEGGATLWLNAWEKEGRKGRWFSLAPRANTAEQQGGPQGGGNNQRQGGGRQDDQRRSQGGGYDSGGGGYDNTQQRERPRDRVDDDEIPF